MPKLVFEWSVSNPDERGMVMVRCHLAGTDLTSFFGPMREQLAKPFIIAKRNALDRSVRTKLDAYKILTPNYLQIGKKPS